jgi:hypothetical protein
MTSTRILATGTIVAGGDVQWHIAPLPELEPPTRDDRVDEAAALVETARYYEWLKAEREDYADYLADIEWLRLGC